MKNIEQEDKINKRKRNKKKEDKTINRTIIDILKIKNTRE